MKEAQLARDFVSCIFYTRSLGLEAVQGSCNCYIGENNNDEGTYFYENLLHDPTIFGKNCEQ